MGRPLKIKISDTRDAGFNNPSGDPTSTPANELFYGVVGGNISTSDYAFPVTTTRIRKVRQSILCQDSMLLLSTLQTQWLVHR